MGHKKEWEKWKKDHPTENEWDIERNGKDEKRPTENEWNIEKIGKDQKRLTENQWDIEKNGKGEKRPTHTLSGFLSALYVYCLVSVAISYRSPLNTLVPPFQTRELFL